MSSIGKKLSFGRLKSQECYRLNRFEMAAIDAKSAKITGLFAIRAQNEIMKMFLQEVLARINPSFLSC
jgi:hypothetical protein